MAWKESDLDAVLVPAGLAVMIDYDIRWVYRIRTTPLDTVIGINHISRTAWVHNIMSDSKGNGVLAVQTIRNSIMASTLLASTAISLSALIGALLGETSSGKSSDVLVVGSHDRTILTVKYLALLVCFLLAFVFHVQAIRFSSHVGFLITIPIGDSVPGLSQDYVSRLLQRSSIFFTLGLRVYYFSFPMLLWLFGPVAHFICCIVLVVLLNIVDTATELKLTPPAAHVCHCTRRQSAEDEEMESSQTSLKSIRPDVLGRK